MYIETTNVYLKMLIGEIKFQNLYLESFKFGVGRRIFWTNYETQLNVCALSLEKKNHHHKSHLKQKTCTSANIITK